MKVLFAHDHRFFKAPDGGIYSGGKLPYSIFCRYLEHFDKMTVVGRDGGIIDMSNRGSLCRASGPGLSFRLLPCLSTPTGFLLRRGPSARLVGQLVDEVDAVIARLPSEIGELAGRAALARCKPLAIECVACTFRSLWVHGRWYGKLYAPISYWNTRRIIGKSSYALYVTDRCLQQGYPCQGVTVACSNVEIDVSSEDTLNARLERIAKRELAEGFTIGQIADLNSQQKGIQVTLKAMAKVVQELPASRFSVVGSGEPARWYDLVRDLGLENNVEFTGFLAERSEVNQWFDSLDLYVHPSLQEGLPRALIEAMSRGIPALGSRVGGIPELLHESALHKAGNWRELASSILKVLFDRDVQRDLAVKGFRSARRYHKPILDERRRGFWGAFRNSISVGAG